jgi:hypothetical protein
MSKAKSSPTKTGKLVVISNTDTAEEKAKKLIEGVPKNFRDL